MKKRNIFWVELTGQATAPKPFDGMSAGTFIDMWGQEAVFEVEDLPTYIRNTRRLIRSTETESGEVVGLPIDAVGHRADSGAAGWITEVELSDDGTKIRFTPRWNDVGRDLIGNDLERFFSPTVDLKNKVILGGSLTNWPATRTATEILLKPVELSSGLFSLDEEQELEQGKLDQLVGYFKRLFSGSVPGSEETSGPAPQLSQEEVTMPEELTPMEGTETGAVNLESMLASDPAKVAELQQLIEARANERLAALLEAEKRRGEIAEFARQAVGGTQDRPKGLPVKQDELAAFCESLSAEQYEQFTSLASAILSAGLVEFDELGHSKTLTGTKPLPEFIARQLQTWVDGGQDIESFFRENAVELGSQADYDLREFKKAE